MSEIGSFKNKIILKTIWDVLVSCCGIVLTAGGGMKILSKADSLPSEVDKICKDSDSTALNKFKGLIKAVF